MALNSIDFDVNRSEIVGLIGENGAGKSTLMKILAGIHQPDDGVILMDGRAVTIRSVRDSVHYGIGFIHQELNVLDNLDIAGNVFLGREPFYGGPLRLINKKRIYADTEKELDRVGLELSPRTPVKRLSSAQRQLVEVAKALSLHTRLLIMDEPTSSLTLKETQRLLGLTKDLRLQGMSVIYISHRLNEIEEIAGRVVALRDGKNAGSLSHQKADHDSMVALMVGRELSSFYGRPDTSAGEVIFEVRSLRTVRYPATEVSLAIRRGEILGLAGLVGAGRSELAQALFGIERQLAGTVLIDGKPAVIYSPRDAIRYGLYLAPEDRRNAGLITEMKVRENVTLASLDQCSSGGLIRREAEHSMTRRMCGELKIKAPSPDTVTATLSGGNQQKVVLAKWLSMSPKVIIFDEPTRGIDVGAKAEIYQMMRRLTDQGVAILMISSDMEEILGNSDRVAVMREGRITGILDRAQCSEEAVMRLAVA